MAQNPIFTPIGGMKLDPARGRMLLDGIGGAWTRWRVPGRLLRRLAIFDEVRQGRGPATTWPGRRRWVPKRRLPQAGVSVAIGSSAVCPEWSAARALAAGDQGRDLRRAAAIAPVAGMGRVVSAAPGRLGRQRARQPVADRL